MRDASSRSPTAIDDDEPGYCDACCNTGEVDCYCGGDTCACGDETRPCPQCHGDDDV